MALAAWQAAPLCRPPEWQLPCDNSNTCGVASEGTQTDVMSSHVYIFRLHHCSQGSPYVGLCGSV